MKTTDKFLQALMFAALAGLAPSVRADEQPGEPLQIGSRLELFVDDFLVEEMAGIRLQLHPPRSAGTVLTLNKPWEGNISWTVCAFKDTDRYRLYYAARTLPDYIQPGDLKPGESIIPAHPPFTCQAESKDGISWTRPSLGLVEFNGSRDNNIVDGTPGFPFIDTNPGTPPAERYKAFGATGHNPRWPKNLETDPSGALLSVSADGVRWKPWKKDPVFRTNLPNAFDSVNVMFWSEVGKQYVGYLRYMKQGIRSFARVTSKDLVNWSEPEPAVFVDAPVEQLYTSAATPYFRAPHLTLAFPKRFVLDRKRNDSVPKPGISDALFMSSRDGVRFNTFREAFIRPGRDERNWVHRTTSVAAGVVPTADDEISIYVVRHYTYPSVHLERFVLRTDGFASMSADATGGEFTTKPLRFTGEELILNFATSAAGSVQVEVQDADGRPIPGYELDRCEPLWGDEIERKVSWRRPAKAAGFDLFPLGLLAEHPIRLRFVLKDADLYSMRFR